MGTSEIDVSVGEAWLDKDTQGFVIKIQADTFELNLWLSTEEKQNLLRLGDACWEDRTSLRIGRAAGSPAWWSCDEGQISILVGEDDECWDFGVRVPISVAGDILADMEAQGSRAERVDFQEILAEER